MTGSRDEGAANGTQDVVCAVEQLERMRRRKDRSARVSVGCGLRVADGRS